MRFLAAAAAVLALAAASCGNRADTVRIGVAGPITGGQAKNGEDLQAGTQIALDECNAKGGVLGKQVSMVIRDDMADPKLAPTVAGQLVDEGVVGVIGHFNSGNTVPASEIYNNAGIVTITPASTAESVTDRGLPTVFRVCGRDDQQGPCAAQFIADTLKAKRVAIYDDKTAYGKGLADGVERALQGKVEVAVREGFDSKERNFRPYLSKLKDANVDVWYFGGIYEQAAPMLIQAKQLGIEAPMMSGDGVHGYPQDFIEKVGKGADGTFTTFPDVESAPGYPPFLAAYKAKFKDREPGPYAVFSYVSAQVLLQAIEKCGSADGRKVAEAIHSGTFDTALGNISFDEKGDVRGTAKGSYVVWVIRDGRHVVHEPGK